MFARRITSGEFSSSGKQLSRTSSLLQVTHFPLERVTGIATCSRIRRRGVSRQTALSFIVRVRPRPSALTGDAIYVGDSWLAWNTHSCGTGFSRECGISGDQFRADVLASSRLKPVPQGDAISVGARLARESAASVYQANRVIVLRRNAAQTKHRSSRKMHSNRCLFHA